MNILNYFLKKTEEKTKKKKYKCPKCDKSFSKQTKLLKHIQKKHKK